MKFGLASIDLYVRRGLNPVDKPRTSLEHPRGVRFNLWGDSQWLRLASSVSGVRSRSGDGLVVGVGCGSGSSGGGGAAASGKGRQLATGNAAAERRGRQRTGTGGGASREERHRHRRKRRRRQQRHRRRRQQRGAAAAELAPAAVGRGSSGTGTGGSAGGRERRGRQAARRRRRGTLERDAVERGEQATRTRTPKADARTRDRRGTARLHQRLYARRPPLRGRRLAELRARLERLHRLGLHHELRRRDELLVVDRSLRLSGGAGRLLGVRDALRQLRRSGDLHPGRAGLPVGVGALQLPDRRSCKAVPDRRLQLRQQPLLHRAQRVLPGRNDGRRLRLGQQHAGVPRGRITTSCRGSSLCANGVCVCPAVGTTAGTGCATLNAKVCSARTSSPA